MSNNIEGKVVLIIGASSGLVKLRHGFSRPRARSSCSARGRQDRLKALAETLASAGQPGAPRDVASCG
jgi:NADP-dependent 3-hydroxy acid dehydrogenase YdfG